MRFRIWTVVFLAIVVCLSTGVLDAVYIYTEPLVRRNEMIKVQRGALEVFSIPYGDANLQQVFEENVVVDTQSIEGMNLYRSKGNNIAFEISGPGFWDKIYALIALEPDMETIKGLKILKHAETPGLGGRITESWFQDQFRGKKLIPQLKIVPYGRAEKPNEVDAITGATGTSRAFERIINNSIGEFHLKVTVKKYKKRVKTTP